MKKLLFGILTILGIGLSFCSADGIYHNSDLGLISIVANGETVYTLQDKNLGATCTDVSDSCSYGNFYQWGNNYPFLWQSYSESSCSVNSSYGPGNYFNSNGLFCSPFNGLNGNNPNLWGAITNTNFAMQGPCPDGFHILYFWSGFISSLSSYFTIDSYFFNSYLFMPYKGILSNRGSLETNKYSFYLNALYHSNINQYNYFVLYLGNSVSIKDVSINFGGLVRCFKNDVVEPKGTWTKIIGDDIVDPPKFKVNYGNTSYEYELSDNLEIHLKSPVNMSGSYNYIYDGKTGLNLFYNGLSQRYNKSELYLNTPSWFNNNIFTPVCL